MTGATPRSITIRVGGIAVGDGEALAPVVGQRRDYHLSFHEVRTIFIDSGLYDEARWIDGVAERGDQVSPGSTTWATALSGPGWTAVWNANRPCRGPLRLYGYFQTELSFFAPAPVGGTVTAVRGNWTDLTLDVPGPAVTTPDGPADGPDVDGRDVDGRDVDGGRASSGS